MKCGFEKNLRFPFICILPTHFQSTGDKEKVDESGLMNIFFHKMIWLIWTLKMKETPRNKYKIHFGPKQIRFGGHCQESAPEGGV